MKPHPEFIVRAWDISRIFPAVSEDIWLKSEGSPLSWFDTMGGTAWETPAPSYISSTNNNEWPSAVTLRKCPAKKMSSQKSFCVEELQRRTVPTWRPPSLTCASSGVELPDMPVAATETPCGHFRNYLLRPEEAGGSGELECDVQSIECSN